MVMECAGFAMDSVCILHRTSVARAYAQTNLGGEVGGECWMAGSRQELDEEEEEGLTSPMGLSSC